MKKLVPLRTALADKNLLGLILEGESWSAWKAILIAAFGEELNCEERRLFESLTKRAQEPLQLVEMLVAIVGRRGGKSRAAAVIAVYIAALCDHSDKIVVGERPVVLCIAQNQKQANVVFSYVAGIFESTPALVSMIANQTADSITLTNGVVIEVRAASFRGLRGVTALAVIADESCFWRTDEGSANGDSEIITAILPALATTGGPLILISSPYSRRGRTWEIYKRHFGPQGDPLILVAQGASRDFNPGLPQQSRRPSA